MLIRDYRLTGLMGSLYSLPALILTYKQPALAIAPIRSALFRLDPTTGTFTFTHLQFIRLCMQTRQYAAAVPILDNYIHSLPSKIPSAVSELEYSLPAADCTNSAEFINSDSGHSKKVVRQDVEEYYLLGAGAYIGLREFKRARDFLEYVLVIPCSGNVASAAMVEAYKKWVLLNCLVDGSVSSRKRNLQYWQLIHILGPTSASHDKSKRNKTYQGAVEGLRCTR